jgi:subtilisin family serine protease
LTVAAGVAALLMACVSQASATSDPLWSQQYGPVQIGAPTAWQKSTGKGVKVAVVDSGIDMEHPDLQKNLDKADSHDFSCNDDNADDDATVKDGEGKDIKGHGTHVAGTIAATANNNIGVAGVAPDAKIMALKVFKSTAACGDQSGLFSTVVTDAIDWAVSHGARVINLSLDEHIDAGAFTALYSTIDGRCRAAFNKGALCVIAAGNAGQGRKSGYSYDIPALIVTANDSQGAHASFGQDADTMWGVSAPGVAVLNTWPIDDPAHNGYNSIQGTSMAAPHVSGAAAVLFGMGMDARKVAETLVKTAGPPRDSLVEGAGQIHLDRAAGFEPVATTLAAPRTNTPNQATPVTRGGRAGAGGGKTAALPTTSTTEVDATGPTSNFDEGLLDNSNSNDINALRLNQASKNSANTPFNATGPLAVMSIVGGLVTTAVSISRIRAKDTPPLT